MNNWVSAPMMFLFVALAVFILGLIIRIQPGSNMTTPVPQVSKTSKTSTAQINDQVKSKPVTTTKLDINNKQQTAIHAKQKQLEKYFQQAVVMLHAKRYDLAIVALHQVLAIDPKMSEAHNNMGFALLGKKEYNIARDFFLTAIDLNDKQLNAYYGLALSHGELKEYQNAIGAMVTFIHLSSDQEQYLQKALDYLQQWRDMVKSEAETAKTETTEAETIKAETSNN